MYLFVTQPAQIIDQIENNPTPVTIIFESHIGQKTWEIGTINI